MVKSHTSVLAGDHASLPAELIQFLRRRSYSLLIKGSAATGKTSLALTILKELGMDNDYLYLSTRVSPSQLFENHPWLGGVLKGPASLSKRRLAAGDGMKKFVDARLDEPIPFFERITNQLMDTRAPVIIVDTWDPIGRMMDGEALTTNTKVLQTWRERADARILFLTEDPDSTTFDSLFDGVVVLKRRYAKGRIVRSILLSKLQGVRINRPSSIFTLDGGIFQSFASYNPIELWTKGLSFGDLAAGDGNPNLISESRTPVSTGYHELDAILEGKAPAGTIVNLELAPLVSAKTASLFLSMILGKSAAGRSVILRPFEGTSPGQAKAGPKWTVRDRSSAREGRGAASTSRKHGSKFGNSGISSIEEEILETRAKNPQRPLFAIVGEEVIGSNSAESEKDFSLLAELMRSRTDLSVIISRGGDGVRPNVSRIADIHLRISEIDGALVLEPQVPWTEFYVFVIGMQDRTQTFSLVPMV